MKKIPTIFLRDYRVTCTPVTGDQNPECAWVFEGLGIATRKIDGINVKIEDGCPYQRIKPITKDYFEALYGPVKDEFVLDAIASRIFWNDGIYEAYGEGIRGNKEKIIGQTMVNLFDPILTIPEAPRDYRGLMGLFSTSSIEGIVFHNLESHQMAKIKTVDFYHLRRP